MSIVRCYVSQVAGVTLGLNCDMTFRNNIWVEPTKGLENTSEKA